MADRTLAAQKALVARLKAQVSAVSGRVYDRAPDGVVFPYIALGEVSAVPWDAQALRGWDALWQVDVWSRRPGRVEARDIMAAVGSALHWHALALDGGALVMCRMQDMRDIADPDGVTTHGIVTVRIVTDG